ncbi:MAG: LysM peptidoglycan-binding domain-containing protein, partial [Neisseria sp.]|nr:LysM peptidoglycan-binding domain-containing protein [Neisseria sp.]
MQKRIITLLCAVGLAISMPALAAGLKLRPDAPARYVVQPGDTLWKISGRYLYSPWQWSRLWGANRSEIRNPHLIYPGQVLALSYVNGQPRLGFEGAAAYQDGIPVVKLTPRVREMSAGYGIQTVNVNFYRMFMQHPQVIPQLQTQDAPKLIEGPDSRMLYSRGDRVYAYGIKEPGRYLVYRANKDIVDPDTHKFLGQEVVFSGIVSTLPYTNSALDARSEKDAAYLPEGEYYTREHPLLKVPTQTAQPMVVEEAVSEIRKGDFLLKMTDEGDSFRMMPHAPNRHIDAKVVSIFDGIGEAGQFQTITLNRGEAAGLEKGTVLSLYKRSRQVQVDLEEGAKGRR